MKFPVFTVRFSPGSCGSSWWPVTCCGGSFILVNKEICLYLSSLSRRKEGIEGWRGREGRREDERACVLK